jgi:hypothetical protein
MCSGQRRRHEQGVRREALQHELADLEPRGILLGNLRVVLGRGGLVAGGRPTVDPLRLGQPRARAHASCVGSSTSGRARIIGSQVQVQSEQQGAPRAGAEVRRIPAFDVALVAQVVALNCRLARSLTRYPAIALNSQ